MTRTTLTCLRVVAASLTTLLAPGAIASISAPISPVTATAPHVMGSGQSPDLFDVKAFETRLVQEAEASFGQSKQPPDALQKELMAKLQSGGFVTTKGIMAVISAWVVYEGPGYKKSGIMDAQGHLCPGTKSCIAAILPYAYGRQDLQVLLYESLGQIANMDHDPATAEKAYEQSQTLQAPLYMDHWLFHNTISAKHGDLLYALDRTADAETEYGNVLIDDTFAAYQDSDWKQQQIGIYVRAGQGLINCRKGDLTMMERTFFSPIVSNVLNPVRDAALKDAGGNPDSLPKLPPDPAIIANNPAYVVALPAGAPSKSSDPITTTPSHPDALISAKTFEAHLVQRASQLKASGQSPDGLQEALLTQLQLGNFVTTKGIMAVVGSWSVYELPGPHSAGKRDAQGHFCPGTRTCIGLLMPYTYGRPDLTILLHEALGEVAEADKDLSTAESEYKQAEDIQAAIFISDWSRYDAISTLCGDLLCGLGKIPQAYSQYANVLVDDRFNYSFDHDWVRDQKDTYTQAGRGLLRCEEYDLPRLQHTFFSKYVCQTLDPVRDDAIVRAGGKPVPSPFSVYVISKSIIPAAPGLAAQ